MRRLSGVRVFRWRPCGRLRRGFQVAPRRGSTDFVVERYDTHYLHRWIAHRGLFILATSEAKPPHEVVSHWGFPEDWKMPVKKRVPAGELPPIPALGTKTVTMRDNPLLVEFISATAYEDGSPREPGYYTVRNRRIEYECTLYDPDSGQRVAIRARELDKLWKGVEVILGAEDAPWEIDRYLYEQLEKKNKKNKVAVRKAKK